MHFLKHIKIRYVFTMLLAVVIIYWMNFYYNYKGFSQLIVNNILYSTIYENKNLIFTIYYWMNFMEKLSFNKESSSYNFERIANEYSKNGINKDFERGQIAYHQGYFAQAIAYIERDIERKGESETKLFWLALSYMRQAETENCLPKLTDQMDQQQALSTHNHHADHQPMQLCSLPLTQFHDQKKFSQVAAQTFEKLLDTYDKSNRLYQWLLNFSYMTIDGFPHDVPLRYRIQSPFIDAFYGEEKRKIEAKYAFLAFEDRARELHVDTNNAGRGVAVEDFDKDGYLDIVTGGSFQTVRYYKNMQGVTFSDQTDAVGLGGITQPFILTAVDYDNDGWMDLFICRPFDHFLLFRNNQDGTFTDVTAASGLLDTLQDGQIAATWVPAWGDVNNDGHLDLFLAQWALKLPFVKGLLAKPRMDSKLFMNENGHFVDKTAAYGLAKIVADQYYIGATFGAFDGDGYADLFLSSPVRNTNKLLKNIAGKRFVDTKLIHRTEPGFAAAFVDVNHDGRLDIFQGGFGDAQTNTIQTVFGEQLDRYRSGHSTIHLQTQDGQFDERNDFFRGDMPMSTMGASYGDINNDGCYDFYLGTGTPEGWFILPNLMYLGETDGTRCTGYMTNISMLQGLGTTQKGHGIVFFDFDNDGKQDIYSSLGGMWPGDTWPNQFFVNKSQLSNQWVKIRLRGRQTNYYGIGATIRITAINPKGEKIVKYYHMDNGTGFGSGPYLAHIGLMDAVSIEEVEVRWPVSKTTKKYRVSLGRLYLLDENGDAAEVSSISQPGAGWGLVKREDTELFRQ